MVEGYQMGSVGPDDDEPSFGDFNETAFIPHQSPPIDLPEEVKQEIAFVYTIGTRKISNMMAVLEDSQKMTFLVEDLLPDTGLTYIGGISGTGKTILATQLVANLVLGRSTMTWQIGKSYEGKHIRALMLSLEMNRKQLQMRAEHMFPNLSPEEQKLIRENFLTYDEPETFELWNISHILELARIIKECKIDVLLIDSASVSFAEELTNQAQVNASVKNLYRLRSRLNFAMVIVAHTRKPPPNIVSNPEDVTLNELFGHSGVAQSADSIVIMLEDEKQRKHIAKAGDEAAKDAEKVVHIINAKSRFGANSGAFKSWLTSFNNVEKGEPLMFRRNAIPIAMTDDQRRKLNSTPGIDLKSVISEADFGSLLDGDE